MTQLGVCLLCFPGLLVCDGVAPVRELVMVIRVNLNSCLLMMCPVTQVLSVCENALEGIDLFFTLMSS